MFTIYNGSCVQGWDTHVVVWCRPEARPALETLAQQPDSERLSQHLRRIRQRANRIRKDNILGDALVRWQSTSLCLFLKVSLCSCLSTEAGFHDQGFPKHTPFPDMG